MRMKKTVSAVAALTIAASAFAGMAVTASADQTLDPIACTQSAGFTNNGANFVLNVAGTETPANVLWNNTKDAWKGVAVLEFELPAVAADRIKSAELTYEVQNNSTRSGGRTYNVYPAAVTINADATADTLQAIALSTPMYNGASLAQGAKRVDTIPSADILDYVQGKVSADAASTVQFAFSNSSQALEINPATASLNLVLFDEGVKTYGVTITTKPYAKVAVKIGEETKATTYNSGASGVVTLSDAEAGTVINYTVEKGGYDTVTGTATVEDKALDIKAELNSAYAYYEDFNTTGTVSDSLSAEGSSASVYGIFVKYGTIKLSLNDAVLSVNNAGGGNRTVSMPLNVAVGDFEADINVAFPAANAWLLLRDKGNQVLAAIHHAADGTVTLGANGVAYNTFNGDYGAQAQVLGTVEANTNTAINIKVDITNSTVTATMNGQTAVVENFKKADSRGSYNGLSTMMIGSERNNTVTIDSIAVKPYVGKTLPTPEATLVSTSIDKNGVPAVSYMVDFTVGADNYAVTGIKWTAKLGELSNSDTQAVTVSNSKIVAGLVVKVESIKDATEEQLNSIQVTAECLSEPAAE